MISSFRSLQTGWEETRVLPEIVQNPSTI